MYLIPQIHNFNLSRRLEKKKAGIRETWDLPIIYLKNSYNRLSIEKFFISDHHNGSNQSSI